MAVVRSRSCNWRWLVPATLAVVLMGAACTPASSPAPTAAPAKPAATTAPAAPAKPATAASPAAQPAAAASPAASTPVAAASPAAKPAASPAASPAAAPGVPKPGAAPVNRTFDQAAVASFYQGKNVRVLVGFGAGGGFDTIFRLWARHASEHIPGNPTMVVENVTGAGGLIAANQLANTAPKDGTVMGSMDLVATVIGKAAGARGIEFEPSQLQWIGNPGDEGPAVCAIRTDLGFNTIEEMIASGKEFVFGASGRGNPFYATPRIVALGTGLKLRVIDGYQGNPAVRLAVDNKELDGACWTYASMRSTAPAWFEGNPPPVKVFLQSGSTPYRDLPNVPLMRTYIKDPKLLNALDVLENAIYHVYLAAFPAGVPADRVAAMRTAWTATWNDPELRQELERTTFRFQAVTGEETTQVVNRILQLPKPEAEEVGRIFGLIQ